MPSSQAAAPERRTERTVTQEPPKLKTTLKTPPKQATNPLQFVKVGPCSLYRTAQEQLQKVQEVKKIKQEIRDDPEDWQSNLDNWKSSRRKRQEHIIERVVEMKTLELEDHDRQRRRSKTFSEMMEERSNRGRKLSISLAVYNEDDANDLSDLGIGTSSGKSSVSGDTHDDNHSVLSDRDSEIEKNHSDVDNASNENGNDTNDNSALSSSSSSIMTTTTAVEMTITSVPATTMTALPPMKKEVLNNGFHKNNGTSNNHNNGQEYDSGTTATVSSPEPEEYTYEGAIRGYVTRVSQNIPRRSLADLDAKFENVTKSASGVGSPTKVSTNNLETKSNGTATTPVVKVDILKRREIFEKASRENVENKNNNNNRLDFGSTKSIKERLSFLERQKSEAEAIEKVSKSPRHSIDSNASSVRERFNREKLSSEKEVKTRVLVAEELEGVKPLRERLSNLEKYTTNEQGFHALNATTQQHNGEISAKSIKDRLISLDANRCQESEKRSNNCFHEQQTNNRVENSTPSERSSSPDSEYRAPRTTFHQSLDSLDADASSGPDTFERVQSLEELDYHQTRRYPASTSSAEILNDTDREDSGIHTADASCSVSQADEPIEEEIGNTNILNDKQQQPVIVEEKTEFRSTIETTLVETSKNLERVEEKIVGMTSEPEIRDAVLTEMSVESAPATVPEEEEEEEEEMEMETPELVEEPEKQQQLQQQETMEREEKEMVTTTTTMSVTKEVTVTPAVRPTTLALERTSLCSDFLSPLSPVSMQILPLSFSSDEEIVTGLSFPLGPPTIVEPPKEKPPPPPVDLSDEENHPIEPLKRLNSTRRIKKELRSRRSDFLGIEGFNDDEFERELTLTKPPDMAAILAEERRIEQLHRRSYDTDSNYEQDSSHERDSGVELGQAEDWTKQPVSPDMSQHSRQSSEPFGASVTSSEEDEITKKEREIIEVLEREEQWRYENNREINSDIGEKLAHKLRELEEEKMQLERARASQESNDNQQQQQQRRCPETLRMNEENLRKQEELTRQQDEAVIRQQEMEKQRAEEKRLQQEEEARIEEQQMRMQEREERERRNAAELRRQEENVHLREKNIPENKPMSPALSSNEDEYASRDVLRVERELLQLEQEELKRQRSNLAYREQKQQQLAEQLQEQWKSMQDVAQVPPPPRQAQSALYSKPLQHQAPLNYRASMPNLLQEQQPSLAQRRRPPPPPPIPPAKPLRLIERQRDVTIRNSRIPSADSIPQQVEAPLRSSCSTTALTNGHQSNPTNAHHGQMTRQTLQALSAVPRSRIVQGDQWVQRRKSDVPRVAHDYTYQHWLIQEAEQRRLTEKSQRSPARKPHVTGTSVPYTASPPRPDSKPLPDSIIQTLTQRVQNRVQEKPLSPRRRLEHSTSQEHLHSSQHYQQMQQHKVHQSPNNNNNESQEKMLSVSGKKKCSHCGDELGRGAAMIIESLRLFYHMECFKCCVCHVRLGDGLMGTDVRVRNHKLHCHNCYSSDDGVKFSCV